MNVTAFQNQPCYYCNWYTAVVFSGELPVAGTKRKVRVREYVYLVIGIITGLIALYWLISSFVAFIWNLFDAALWGIAAVVFFYLFRKEMAEPVQIHERGTVVFCPRCGAFYATTVPPNGGRWDMREIARMLNLPIPPERIAN